MLHETIVEILMNYYLEFLVGSIILHGASLIPGLGIITTVLLVGTKVHRVMRCITSTQRA